VASGRAGPAEVAPGRHGRPWRVPAQALDGTVDRVPPPAPAGETRSCRVPRVMALAAGLPVRSALV